MLCVSGYVRGYIAPNILVLYSAWSTPVALSTPVSSVDRVKVILLWNPQQSWEEPCIYQITPHRIVQSAFLLSGRWGSLIVRSSWPSVEVLEALLVSFYDVNRLSFALCSTFLIKPTHYRILARVLGIA